MHKAIDWATYAVPGLTLSRESLLEEAHQEMLRAGADFAAVLDEKRHVLALASFKRLAAVLSAKYGQALFSRRQLGGIRVHSKIIGASHRSKNDDYMEVVTPLGRIIVLRPDDDFFEAQRKYELRPEENHFDDFVLVDSANHYAGMLTVREFNRLQHQMLIWQESELIERNLKLEKALGDLSRTQGELVNAAKMAALGELVNGITHEINTPLGVLLGSQDIVGKVLEKILVDPALETNSKPYTTLIESNIKLGRESAGRISRIIDSLRTFGESDQTKSKEADLVSLSESALTLLSNLIKNHIAVETEYPPDGRARLTCHPGQISQAFVHILTNAVQAMRGEGKIAVSIRKQSDLWMICFRDTGPGVPVEIRERIFDPGFTTRGVGVGTGLGLSISKKIIEMNHGGKITVENHPEGGAIFCLALPIERDATHVAQPEEQAGNS